ncbi:PREDICTED: LEAF RUST 10 DISEASE-RESISTANCE LOCUS RECEPTOR-LIKE PROTEIN KINASE-like 2.4 [Camelina sativa]|uniref:LEAF RUST 10 DISEASE-RESISTANCE LOCUS RECEPTOR-LIKE PROTEIN KINASE-like 2.4 n=1 Tax=Camelina sativa TaxID=90675 RepID=A0ABM0X0K1_CAMSA|nr:PREDICTED: LEAF RUST 10 DISEASE-RESISTANCE LOCUS RECEPTOR-LIKE PROTEIN KINASE-like 2.4 [Camelina sativa]
MALLFLLASHLLVTVMSRTITIENKCEHPIWPASYAYAGELQPTGFLLDKGYTRRTINVTSSWIGYIWGRTLCTTNSSGGFSCVTGDCNSGQIECSGPSQHLATLAEFNLASENRDDYYDVNVINGYNLPLLVTPENEKCKSIGCVVELNKTCPSELRLYNSDTGSSDPYACRTSCQKTPSPEICCVGIKSVVGPKECKRTIYSESFNKTCPGAYSYTYDTNISTFTCPRSSNFVVTFCPSSLTKPVSVQKPPLWTGEEHRAAKPWKLKLILGISSVLALMIIVAVVVMVRAYKMKKSDPNGQNIEEIVMLKRYSYVQVKRMTKSFANVLGKGGFGTVYKGKLPDGSRDIAVKILKESNGNGEEFINEVASMSRTSHVNIVSLLGFCFERNKKAIIYEFVPNGSLDKFISQKMSEKMEWKTLFNIAVGVSHGLEYLHNRCISRIVHFDIKPQNILIAGDSCPKISDFGLAKLCKNNESIMSMLEARGTAGYIAPEVFSKTFGAVSHKSDVYSYGMVVLEMIGARSIEMNDGSNNTSMYFPDWIYKDLEKGENMSFLADQITDKEDEKIVKKMVLVGLWCIQTNPFDRPPVSKVVEMLEGSLEALQIPPKPLLSLPAVTIHNTVDAIQETPSFSRPSVDTSHNSEEPIQDIVKENQDSLRSF